MKPFVQRKYIQARLHELFTTNTPALETLLVDVYQNSILPRIMEAEAPIPHTWITPGGWYHGHWIWDNMFVVELLVELPEYHEVIRDVFRNYWVFQAELKKYTPKDWHGMVPNNVKPRTKFPVDENGRLSGGAFNSQHPLLGWGLENVYRANGDRALVEEALEPLNEFHQWYWRERDVRDQGLVAVGSYAGIAQSARFETFDSIPHMDDLYLTRHPLRGNVHALRDELQAILPAEYPQKSLVLDAAFYGDVISPENTFFLIRSERALQRLATEFGRADIADRAAAAIEKGVAAARKHLWDEETGYFYAAHRDTLEQIKIPTVSTFLALTAGVADEAQAARLVENLSGPDWMTPMPIPTVARSHPMFGTKHLFGNLFWRGDVWPQVNHLVLLGLAEYGFHEIADTIATRAIKNAFEHGLNERFDPDTGKGLGVEWIGMSCAALTSVL